MTIVNSVFRNNGNPDICCFMHGVYVDEAASLTVAGSLFCGQLIGHDIKSRAQQTAIIGNHIYSGEGAPANSGCRVGNTSLDVDLANGGVGLIWGNTLVQGPSAQNHKLVDYGEEGLAFATNSLVIARNAFTSTTQSLGICDPNCVPAELAANTFVGLGQIIDPASCIAPGEPGT